LWSLSKYGYGRAKNCATGGIFGAGYGPGRNGTIMDRIRDMSTKHIAVLFLAMISFASCVMQSPQPVYLQPVYVGPGIGLGTIIAVIVSWSRNKSILFAIIHGILGWLYVIYAAIFPKK
jgi:hypothetical protein